MDQLPWVVKFRKKLAVIDQDELPHDIREQYHRAVELAGKSIEDLAFIRANKSMQDQRRKKKVDSLENSLINCVAILDGLTLLNESEDDGSWTDFVGGMIQEFGREVAAPLVKEAAATVGKALVEKAVESALKGIR